MVPIVILLAAAYATYRLALWRRVETRLASIRAAGYPVTLAELNAWYPTPPANENAALVLLRGFGCLPATEPPIDPSSPLAPIASTNMPPRNEPFSDTARKEIADYLERRKGALPHIHAGARLKRSRYSIDLTQGYGTLLPHLNPVRRSVRLLCVEALEAAENHDDERATTALVDAFGLARSLEREPVLVSHLVQMAADSTSLFALEQVLNRCILDEDRLRDLDRAVREAETSIQPLRAFAGERCLVLDATLNFPEAMSRGSGSLSPIDRLRYAVTTATGVRDRRLIQYLDATDRILQAHELAWPQRLRAVRDSAPGTSGSSSGELARAVFGVWDVTGPLIFLDSRGTMESPIRRHANLLAGFRCAGAAIAIERYRLKMGALPSSLSDLVPAYLATVPNDPFDGRPLRFCLLPQGYIVYSVGEDEVDDGGREKAPPTRPSSRFAAPGRVPVTTDITFTMERPPQ